MAITQNNMADAFVYITDLHHHLSMNVRKSDLQSLGCLYFVKYLNCKSKYGEKVKSFLGALTIEENKILESLGEFIISDEGIQTISKSVGNIQQILLEALPPETDEFKYIVEFVPDAKQFLPK